MAPLAPSWDTGAPRLRAGSSPEGGNTGPVIACLSGPFKWLASFPCGCFYSDLICRWVNCSLPRLALLLQAGRVLAGVLLFVCSGEAACIRRPWGRSRNGSRCAPDPCSSRFQSHVFARAPQTPPVFWKCVPVHCPGCCHRRGWFPTLNPLLCEWPPQEAQHPGWVAAREPPAQLDVGNPLRAALAVASLLC